MTKKDYEMIANVLKNGLIVGTSNIFMSGQSKIDFIKGTTDQYCEYVLRFSQMLAQGNPRFDHARFLEACGL